MPRVWARYEDGEYWLESVDAESSSPDTYDISEEDWREYQSHCAECAKWDEYIRELRNES